jgi:hypothetical protein
MRTAAVLVLVCSSALLVASGPKNKLLGKWDVVLTNKLPAVAVFNDNGTMEYDADNPAAKTMKIIMKAKYRLTGDKLYITFTDVDFKNTPAEARAQESQLKEGLRKQIEVGKEKMAVVTWSGANSFKTVVSPNKVTTYKRKS